MNIKALEYSALNTNYIIEQFTEFIVIMTPISTLFEYLGVKLFERIRKCDLLEEMCHCRWALRLQKPKQCPMSLSSSILHIWIKNFQFFSPALCLPDCQQAYCSAGNRPRLWNCKPAPMKYFSLLELFWCLFTAIEHWLRQTYKTRWSHHSVCAKPLKGE